MKNFAQDRLDRANALGTPLIEGNTATFVWQGEDPPILRGDWNDWDEVKTLPWRRAKDARSKSAAGPVWTASLELAPDAYMEYGLGTDEDRVADPLNPRRVTNGMGQFNHWFYMPQGGPTPLVQRQRDAPKGEVIRLDLPTSMMVAGRQRSLVLYKPPAAGPTPLLLVYDGPDYLRRANLVTVVENLLAQQRIRPVALAMIANGRSARMAEYGSSDATLAYVQQVVLPAARQHLDLVDITTQRGAFGVMGASMGGLMALVTGLRLPQIFGQVLSQSGAFYLGDYATVAVDLVQHIPVPPLRVWMDVGRYEGLRESNRRTLAMLQDRGYDVTYCEFNAGHNYSAWRNDLWRGLEALFPWNGS